MTRLWLRVLKPMLAGLAVCCGALAVGSAAVLAGVKMPTAVAVVIFIFMAWVVGGIFTS